MDNDSTVLLTKFRNLSAKIFQTLFDGFRQSVKSLDRKKDENEFQQIQGRYITELEKQLSREAGKMIGEHRGHSAINTLQKELASQISSNVSEFLLKTKSM